LVNGDGLTPWVAGRRVVAARQLLNRIPRHWIVFLATAGLLFMVMSWGAERFAVSNTDRGLARYASAAAELRATGLQSAIEKHRSLPLVLSDDADIRATLLNPSPEGIERLNLKLNRMSVGTNVSVIYILNRQGATIASSNWNDPASFVGKAYTFRPYFKNAMQKGVAEYFALGATSHRSGLYLAHRVDGPGAGLGVVVVKEQFDDIEAQWCASIEQTFVTDKYGTVLLTTDNAWRFRKLQGVAGGQHVVAPHNLPFNSSPRGPPLRNVPGGKIEDRSGKPIHKYIAAEAAAGAPGWTLHLLVPADRPEDNAVALARGVAFLLTTTLMVVVGFLYHRRARALANATAHERTRQILETQVEARTHELRNANEKLVREMDERRRAEAKLLTAQDGLTQSNKLATLGQIAAGVAHEIKQPVAAIRAYADNSLVLLDRERVADARANLGFIATLTEQIDFITNEMKDFSRKSRSKTEIIDLHAAIEGALFLTGWRLRSRGVVLNMEPRGNNIHVFGDKSRIEQVLVNLINNAIDALAEVSAPRIDVSISTSRDKATLAIADNGHGIAIDDAQSIFLPFFTTKKDGLGLGLVISRDVVTELGGELSFESTPSCGSKFFITLRRAVPCSPK
jgi:two-component system C4-dicarboxylate transport sensor histidine kinase DctB